MIVDGACHQKNEGECADGFHHVSDEMRNPSPDWRCRADSRQHETAGRLWRYFGGTIGRDRMKGRYPNCVTTEKAREKADWAYTDSTRQARKES
jgi:hypothetical protein